MDYFGSPLKFILEFAMPQARQLRSEDILTVGSPSTPDLSARQMAKLRAGAHRDSVHHIVWTPAGRTSLTIEDSLLRFERRQIAIWPALTNHNEYSTRPRRTQFVWLLSAADRVTFLSQGAVEWGMEIPDPSSVNRRVENMIRDVGLRDKFHPAYFTRELSNLLVDLVRRIRQTNPRAQRSWYDSVCRAMECYVESHLSDPNLTLARVARHVRLCQSYASSLYSRHTGTPLWGFVREARLRAARKMLLDARLNISEVARLLGYTSVRHFRRLFKKATGVSPREFRATGGGDGGEKNVSQA